MIAAIPAYVLIIAPRTGPCPAWPPG